MPPMHPALPEQTLAIPELLPLVIPELLPLVIPEQPFVILNEVKNLLPI